MERVAKDRNPQLAVGKTYFSGAGGLLSTADHDYAQFGMMLANGGMWNGKRQLSPKTV